MLKNENNLNNKKINSVEDYNKNMDKIAAQEKAQANSAAHAAAESEKAFKDMGAAIYGALQPALAMLTPIVNDLANEFMGFVKNNMPAIKEALTKFTTFVINFAKDLFSEEGRNKIINDIKYYFGLIMIELKKATLGKIGLYSDESAKRDEEQLKTQKDAFDKSAEVQREKMSIAGKEQALQDLANGKTKEKYQEEIDKSSKAIADLEKQKEAAGKDQDAITSLQRKIDDEKIKQDKAKLAQSNVSNLENDPKAKAKAEEQVNAFKAKETEAKTNLDAVAPHVDIKDYNKQDDENWKKMRVDDKIESSMARGIENIGTALGKILPDVLGSKLFAGWSETAKDTRIQNESDELAKRDAEAKKKALEKKGTPPS
jgi:hypothetical protein